MRRQELVVTTCLLFTLLLSSAAAGQTETWEEVFASVPEPRRARLLERFRLMAQYERTEQWGQLYDLLIQPRVQSREAFIEQRRGDATRQQEKWLMEFVPASVDKEQLGTSRADYRIVGYAKVRERGCIVKRNGAVYAFLREGEWYFSGYIIELTPSHSPPPPCLSEDGE